ncbi:hypothetical protein HanRHA438_Chr13g0621491 [Helianthus annuus]|nr:hypothetical protein HanRHA438_Chr13g0621491 [Helianthus annuus]
MIEDLNLQKRKPLGSPQRWEGLSTTTLRHEDKYLIERKSRTKVQKIVLGLYLDGYLY